MSPRDLTAQNCAVSTSGAEFAALTFDVCMQLVHGAGPAMPPSDREQLLQLATAAVRMLGTAVPAPAPAVVTEQARRAEALSNCDPGSLLGPAVWRYA